MTAPPRITCPCGADCSQKSDECKGQVFATKYEGSKIAEHLCDFHKKQRETQPK